MIMRLWRSSGAGVVCTVHEPPDPPADRLDLAESLVFVPEGFSWAAALFTPVWLLANRLWLALLGYLAAIVLLAALATSLGVPEPVTTTAILAIQFLIGFEADSLRRWSLETSGWRMLGSATGDTLAECERRFFEAWLPTQPIIRIGEAGAPPPLPTSATVSRAPSWRRALTGKA